MSDPKPSRIHKAGIKVLKAISAPIRIQILGLLLQGGVLSYTEIINFLKLDPNRDAGRFAYHLKSLIKSDLIEVDTKTKLYRLTDLGRRVIEITEEIENRTHKRRKVIVRTSNFSIEEFDRNKITRALITEAEVPSEIAQKVAQETEKRLLQFKTKYLTAPLIREIANTILLEKHYEEYRHRLTRLGLPVHDVKRLINTTKGNVETLLKKTGAAVFEEYTLLKIIPRKISDAYLSGSLHINGLSTWILKINEITHSLPFFFQAHMPKSLKDSLKIILNTTKNMSTELTGYQNLDNFNIHLAKYSKGMDKDQIKRILRLFIMNINLQSSSPITINLDLSVENAGSYEDEATNIAISITEELIQLNKKQSLSNPKIILKIRKPTQSEKYLSLLLKTHELLTINNNVYFANLCTNGQNNATYTASGLRLADDWQKDWELDTLRTGNLQTININIPRVAIVSKQNETKFFEVLDQQLNMAFKAFKIKYDAIQRRIKQNLLPSLAQKTNGDPYIRMENLTQTIVPIGLQEAANTLLGNKINENSEQITMSEEILKHIVKSVNSYSKKKHIRLTTAIIPNAYAAMRLAKLDAEAFGQGIVRTKGSRKHPSYSDINTFSLVEEEKIIHEEKIHRLALGGHLSIIDSQKNEPVQEELLDLTKELLEKKVYLFTYKFSFTHCHNCKTTFQGLATKCPNCSSTNTTILS